MGDDCTLLFQADLGRERHLNATGTFIWERLDGRRSPDDIAGELASAFDVDMADAARDVGAFATELVEQRFATLDAAAARPQVLPAPVDRDAAPMQVDISLTGRCNGACSYCFYADEMERRPDLPGEAWLAFFAELGSLAVRSVCLSGGEVFMRPDLWSLVDGLVEQRMRFSLVSNGTLVDDGIVGQLVQRRARLDSVQISIDGSCAEVHDRCRGEGSFARALRGLELLHEARLPVTSRVTITRHNIEDLEAITELLLERVGLPRITTNQAVAMGSCRKAGSLMLDARGERAAMVSLARLERRYPGRVLAMAGPLAHWRMFHAMERVRSGGGERTPLMGRLTACGCVLDKIAVNHDGSITPCTMLASMVMGRIGETPLGEVWRNHVHMRALRERRRVAMTAVPECQGCEWAEYCNGSCPAVQFGLTGSLYSPDPADCYRRFVAEVGRVPAL